MITIWIVKQCQYCGRSDEDGVLFHNGMINTCYECRYKISRKMTNMKMNFPYKKSNPPFDIKAPKRHAKCNKDQLPNIFFNPVCDLCGKSWCDGAEILFNHRACRLCRRRSYIGNDHLIGKDPMKTSESVPLAIKARIVANSKKPYICKQCSETRKEKFVDSSRTICSKCKRKYNCENMTDSYVANFLLRTTIDKVSKETFEIKRNLLKEKRAIVELNQAVKTKQEEI